MNSYSIAENIYGANNMDEILRVKFLRQLGIPSDDYNYLQKVQLDYVYSRLSEALRTDDFNLLLDAMRVLEGPRRVGQSRLDRIYYRVKTTSMTDSQRYDTTTLQPPQEVSYDKGWRL